ncbi:MAG: hypothetical protein GOU97_04830 [Nanoarchaeota archaeon]|nr:hypothetical protein [Nanoarchaeota archaeon]
MFAKPEWFKRRKYTGWGLTPATWQGWVYILFMIGVLIVFNSFDLSQGLRLGFNAFWIFIILIDLVDVLRNLKKDERDRIHEAIAERNAAWVMSFLLAMGLLYDLVLSALKQEFVVHPFLVIALFGGVVAKAFSNWKLGREN